VCKKYFASVVNLNHHINKIHAVENESEMAKLVKDHSFFLSKAKEEIARINQKTNETIAKTNDAVAKTNKNLETLARVNQAIATAQGTR
jgi:chromosome segregation ATPase